MFCDAMKFKKFKKVGKFCRVGEADRKFNSLHNVMLYSVASNGPDVSFDTGQK